MEKFIYPYIGFVQKNFDFNSHFFWVKFNPGDSVPDNIINVNKVLPPFINRLIGYISLIFRILSARKIILHGLFNFKVLLIIWLLPHVRKKCYWNIWGADLYQYKQSSKNIKWHVKQFFMRSTIKDIGYIVSGTPGDAGLVKKWYGGNSTYINCFNYLSNLHIECCKKNASNKHINILVGNSADPTNNHLEIFNKIERYKDDKIIIHCPLSYGDSSYASVIIDEGKRLFGDKFLPVIDVMPFDEYKDLLCSIDIAIFNHDRQQAMGNIRALVGMGKKVHMRNSLTSTDSLKSLGVKVFSIEEINLIKSFPESKSNAELMKENYSKEKLIISLSEIFR